MRRTIEEIANATGGLQIRETATTEEMRSVSEMAEILGKLDATHISSEDAIANYLLQRLEGGRRVPKIRIITTVLMAYAKLLQDNGVKITD